MSIQILQVDSDGKLVIEDGELVWLYDNDAVTQLIAQRLKTFKGECDFNTELGVDYYGVIFKKGASDFVIYTELRNIIEETPGVVRLIQMQLARDNSLRELTVTCSVESDYGTIDLSEVI